MDDLSCDFVHNADNPGEYYKQTMISRSRAEYDGRSTEPLCKYHCCFRSFFVLFLEEVPTLNQRFNHILIIQMTYHQCQSSSQL